MCIYVSGGYIYSSTLVGSSGEREGLVCSLRLFLDSEIEMLKMQKCFEEFGMAFAIEGSGDEGYFQSLLSLHLYWCY